MEQSRHPHLSIGTEYDSRTIADIVEYDDHDDYQPYLYQLDDGTLVWIPLEYTPGPVS